MSSTRLTNATREALLGQLMNHAFAGRCVTHFQAELDFVQEVYDHVMTERKVRFEGKDTPVGEVVKKLPLGWASREDYFKAEFAGQTIQLGKYYGMYHESCQSTSKLIGVKQTPHHQQEKWYFPPKWGGHGTLVAFDARHELSLKATALNSAFDDLVGEMARVRVSTKATLEAANTVQRLIVLWPEVESFARQFLTDKQAAAVLLPVVQREMLNDALGLPVGELA